MVFGALTEYGIILYFTIQKKNCSSADNRTNRNLQESDCDVNESERTNCQVDGLESKKTYILDKKSMMWIEETGQKKEEKSSRTATFGENILKNADSFSLMLFSSLFLPFTFIYSIMLHQ